MTSATTEKCSAEPSMVAAHYETLRRAALGGALPPEARTGLVLFLRRGLWGWARMLAAAGTSPPPIRPTSSGSTAPHKGRGVIYVFASMAMNATYNDTRRAP